MVYIQITFGLRIYYIWNTLLNPLHWQAYDSCADTADFISADDDTSAGFSYLPMMTHPQVIRRRIGRPPGSPSSSCCILAAKGLPRQEFHASFPCALRVEAPLRPPRCAEIGRRCLWLGPQQGSGLRVLDRMNIQNMSLS